MPSNQYMVRFIGISDMIFSIFFGMLFLPRCSRTLHETEIYLSLCPWMGLITILICLILQIGVDLQLSLSPKDSVAEAAQTWQIFSSGNTFLVVVWQLTVFKTYVLSGVLLVVRVFLNYMFIDRILPIVLATTEIERDDQAYFSCGEYRKWNTNEHGYVKVGVDMNMNTLDENLQVNGVVNYALMKDSIDNLVF